MSGHYTFRGTKEFDVISNVTGKKQLQCLHRRILTNVGDTNQIGEGSIITFTFRIGHMIRTDSNENKNRFRARARCP